MMSPALNMQRYYATALASNSAANVFAANQAMMGLANAASAVAPPLSVGAMATLDKALRFQGEDAKLKFEVAQRMQESNQRQIQRERQSRQNLANSGFTF